MTEMQMYFSFLSMVVYSKVCYGRYPMKNAFIKLHISIFLAGFTSIFGKLIQLNEAALVCYRMGLASIILYIMLKLSKQHISTKIKEIFPILIVGGILTIHWLFFYASIKFSTVSVGVICFSLTGFYTALFEPILLKRNFQIKEFMFSLITLIGIMLIFHFDTQYRTGIVLGVISSAFAALYTIGNKKLTDKFTPTVITYYEMLCGFVFTLIVVIPIYLHVFPHYSFTPSVKDIVYIVLFTYFCTIVLQILQIESLQKLSAFTVNLSYNLEPVYSIILAAIIFKEMKNFTISFYAGLILIIISVLLQTLSAKKTA